VTYVTSRSKNLNDGVEVSFQPFDVKDGELVTVDQNETLRLQAGDVARDQLAHRPDLRRKFLMCSPHEECRTAFGQMALGFYLAQYPGDQPVPDRRE
jgi:hypothetical protein